MTSAASTLAVSARATSTVAVAAAICVAASSALLGLGGCASTGSSASSAADSRPIAAQSADATQIELLERQRFASTVARDYPALQALLAADLRYCHSNARCETRAQFLDSLRSGTLIYRAIEPVEITPRLEGGVWLIHGRAKLDVESAGTAQRFEIVYTNAYALRGGRWQLIAWQSTRVP